MAPSNGNSTTTSVARKKLVQPVLPALPVFPKIKNAPVKIKEEQEFVNGAESTQSTIAKIQTDAGLDKEENLQDIKGNGTALLATQKMIENHDIGSSATQVENSHPDMSNGLAIPKPSYIHDDPDPDPKEIVLSAAMDSPATSGVEAPSSLSSEQITTGDDLAHNGARENSTTVNAEKIANGNESNPDMAPEVVAGASEASPFSGRSENYSAVVSSIYDTPNNAATPSVASGIFPTASANRSRDENGHEVSEMAPNGSAAAFIKSANVSNRVNISMSRQGMVLTILDYIGSLEHSREWSDCELQIISPNSQSSPLIRHAHSLILLRSERLRSMLYQMRAQSYVYFTIPLFPARPIDPNAFDAALRFLYADTVLSAERLLPTNTAMDRLSKTHALDYILSYMAAGLELGVEPVVGRSFDLLNRLLDWDLAELVVKEALSMRAVWATAPHAPLEIGIAVDAMLQSVFSLFITGLDVRGFTLDTTAAPVGMPTRLGQFDFGRAPINPALANMVFGSMPVLGSPTSPTSPYTKSDSPLSPSMTASIILLNLEFNDLCMLARGLKRVYEEDGTRIIREAVEERERRRLSIFENKSISNKQRLQNQGVWDIIGWREYLVGDVINRDRVGFLLDNNNKRGTYI